LNSFENEPAEGQRTSAGLDSSSSEGIVSGENRTVPTTDSSAEPVSVDVEGSISADVVRGWHGWHAPSRTQIWTGVAFWAVILLGAVLRFWGLGTKPLHWDESLHAYFSMVLLRDNVDNWRACFTTAAVSCYRYDPLTHGPFQFHIIALVYQISAWLGAPDHGINTTTVRIAAATFGSVMVALPYFLRDYLGKMGAWLACLLLAVSPGLVYYSRFAREDIYMACFTVLTVVATARYVRDRKMGWLVTAALAFTLAYATKESIFLVIGLFGSFLGALLVWELGVRWAPWLVLCYFVVVGLLAKWVLGLAGNLSRYITASTVNTNHANVVVGQLKQTTQVILPWLGILLVILVVYLLIRDQFRTPPEGRYGLAARIDPKQQPLLDTIVTMPWTHWFFAVVLSWFLFMLLFTVLFTNIATGIGDGIWQGLYYWLQQQNVARGGQPWYYYLLLIPLYEQIGVVFGLAGVVYVLFRPTRLRLFLVYWFLGNLVIYTWAGEKMPWLMIHITIPMLILAAIALQPAASVLWQTLTAFTQRPGTSAMSFADARTQGTQDTSLADDEALPAGSVHTDQSMMALGTIVQTRRLHPSLLVSSLIVLGALLLLAPTLQNMYQVSYIHQADAPHEMMIYVQTSTDINTVMDKIQAIDQKLYHGTHTVPIGVTSDTGWPFAWYLRDYTNVCYQFPTNCQATASTYPIILGSGGELFAMQRQYALTYQYHQYHERTQWDQGYMPPPCVKSVTNNCSTLQPYVGVGLGLWLSYGDNPPKGATFNLWRAASNIWQWWWERKPFGAVDGSYDMGLFIRNQAVNSSGVTP
jgi:TIGR03663 family protein